MNGLSLSAVRMLDQALAAMGGKRSPVSGETLPAGVEGASAAPRVGFEQQLASQYGGEAPVEDGFASPDRQGRNAVSDDAATDGEREDMKSAAKKHELNPSEHPLLALLVPVPDAARPVARMPAASSPDIAVQARVPQTAVPQAFDGAPTRQTSDSMPRALPAGFAALASQSANPLASANARGEYIPVTAAARFSPPVTGKVPTVPTEGQGPVLPVAVSGNAVAAQPIDRLKARIATYFGRGPDDPADAVKGDIRATPAANNTSRAIADTVAPAPVQAANVAPTAAFAAAMRGAVQARPVAASTTPIPPASDNAAMPGEAAAVSNEAAKPTPPPQAPAPPRTPMSVSAPVAAAVESAGKEKRMDSDIGDPSAFGLDEFAKAATGTGDAAQIVGTQNGQSASSMQAVAEQAAGQPLSMDRAILDFSKGLAWIDRLASEISAMGSSEGELSFDLNPENLGNLTVSMKKDETGIKLALHVMSQDAANHLAASQTQLKQELNNAGLQLGSFDIGHQAASGGEGNGSTAARSGSSSGSADQAGEMAAEGTADILGDQSDPGVRFA